MELTPREKDKLLLFTAALLAERRQARGLKLNWEQKEISDRIAALDVRPAEIPPTETPGPQLDYRDTTTSWADLRKLADILAAEGDE